MRHALEQRGRADDLSGGAEPALECVLGHERLLHHSRPAAGEALDGDDLVPAGCLREDEAGIHGASIEQDAAGTAGTLSAGELRAEELEILAQDREQSPAARLDGMTLAVDLENDPHEGRTTDGRLRTSSGYDPTVRRVAATIAMLVASALLLAGCGGSSKDATATTGAATTPASTSTTAGSSGHCRDVTAPSPRADGGAKEPTERLDPERTYRLVFTTNCGTFTITLDQQKAPATAASLVSLANQKFYDDTIFHRIVPGFVIQGGDPTQTGSGGPGYQTVDAPPADAAYTKGIVAMAKTASEPAGTSGSQFFIVTAADAQLPPDYAIVGTVTDGLDVVERIGKLGDASEQPTRPVVIESVVVESQ